MMFTVSNKNRDVSVERNTNRSDKSFHTMTDKGSFFFYLRDFPKFVLKDYQNNFIHVSNFVFVKSRLKNNTYYRELHKRKLNSIAFMGVDAFQNLSHPSECFDECFQSLVFLLADKITKEWNHN